MELKPDFEQILEEVKKGNKATLRYSRVRLLATWLAVGLLAILTCLSLVALDNNAETDNAQTEEIAMLANSTADEAGNTADQAAADTDDVVSYLQGEQGIPGVPGTDGQDGTPGLPSSEPGPQGEPGAPGEAGSIGPGGATGPQGLAGTAGPLGPIGPAGINGDVGTQGSQGPKGDKGDEGARGAEGPQGPTGPQGPAGTAAAPTTTVAIGQSANDPNEPKSAVATCPSGRASGGGYALVPSDPGLIVTASSPVGNTGWNATVEELSLPAATNWQVLVFAICVT